MMLFHGVSFTFSLKCKKCYLISFFISFCIHQHYRFYQFYSTYTDLTVICVICVLHIKILMTRRPKYICTIFCNNFCSIMWFLKRQINKMTIWLDDSSIYYNCRLHCYKCLSTKLINPIVKWFRNILFCSPHPPSSFITNI